MNAMKAAKNCLMMELVSSANVYSLLSATGTATGGFGTITTGGTVSTGGATGGATTTGVGGATGVLGVMSPPLPHSTGAENLV